MCMIAYYDKSPMLMCARDGCPRLPKINQLLWIVIFALSTMLLGSCGNSAAGGPEPVEKGGGGGGKGGGRRGAGGGDVPVTIATASVKDVPVEIQVIGNVEAYSTISVRAQVTGQITNVFFKEGDFVKKNDPLFTIDPRPLAASLNQMQANLLKDKAVLGQAQATQLKDEAQARFVEAQAQRYSQLFDQKIVSKDQAEQFRANADAMAQTVQADKAAIESVKASIGASEAAIENAKVQLGFTNITSPITGRTGNLTVKQGNIANANNMELVTIVQVEPIYVTFAVPEAQLTAVKKYMAVGKLPVRVRQQDDSSTEETGVL